jgi:hypothetical protein
MIQIANLTQKTFFALITNQGNMGELDVIKSYYRHELLAEIDSKGQNDTKINPISIWEDDDGKLYSVKELGRPFDKDRDPYAEIVGSIKEKLSPTELKYLKLDTEESKYIGDDQ